MRVAALLIVVCLLTSCGADVHRPSGKEPAPWVLLDDEANLAVLVVDYETYAFEGGSISHYPLCEGCDKDSLPFEMEYSGDDLLKFLALLHTETGDTVFLSSVPWMAAGQIHVPPELLNPDKFEVWGDSVPLMSGFEQFGGCGFLSDRECEAMLRQAWKAVSSLDVVHAFGDRPHSVGFYLYPRWGSRFSPSYADWVIFLYSSEVAT